MRHTKLTLMIVCAALSLAGCGSSNLGPSGGGNSTPSQPHVYDGPCDETATPFGGGAGTLASPYMICSATHLNNMSGSAYSASNFILIDNINLNTAAITQVPTFGGTFDGNGKTISNLGGNVPIFVNLTGTVKDLSVTNANVTASYRGGIIAGTVTSQGSILNSSVSGTINASYMSGGLVGLNGGQITNCTADMVVIGWDHLGGLAGANTGTITNCSSSGSVTGGPPEGNDEGVDGGLVGWNNGGTITHSHSSASVTGQYGVGGLVGMDEQGTINTSYATGSVTGQIGTGGFVGITFNNSTLINNYATGNVSSTSDAGGFVGDNGSNISNCYSRGSVASGSASGGFAGAASYVYQPPGNPPPAPITYNGTVTSSYWDLASGQSSSAAGTGESDANMQAQSTFNGWDFSAVWTISGGYPTLQ